LAFIRIKRAIFEPETFGDSMRTSIWKGSISFGLINIPITVQSAEKDKSIHFNLLDQRNMSPIKYNRVNAKTGKEVPSDKIVKGYKYEAGKYVIMTKDDFDEANPKATQTIDIADFVSMDDIDLLLFERPYYLAPQNNGEKSFHLLHDALKKAKKVAVAKMVLHTKQHLCCIFPRGDNLVLEVMRFAHSVKDVKDAVTLSKSKDKIKYSAAELKMAEQLVSSMTSKWNPEEYTDTYYDDLMKHIHRKIKAGEGKEVDVPHASKSESAPSRTEDIMALLKRSLAEGKGGKKNKKVSKDRVDDEQDGDREGDETEAVSAAAKRPTSKKGSSKKTPPKKVSPRKSESKKATPTKLHAAKTKKGESKHVH
jgi:DNA end-binding protein Ku